MISELDFLFDKKIERFCKVNSFKYINIIKLMFGKYAELASRIVNSSQEEISINAIFNENEIDKIKNAYNQHILELEEKSRIIAIIGNLNEKALINSILNSQDLIKRLSKKSIKDFQEREKIVNDLNKQCQNYDLYRKKLAMGLLDKSVKDARFFDAPKNKIL